MRRVPHLRCRSWAGRVQQVTKTHNRRGTRTRRSYVSALTWSLVVFTVSGGATELNTPGAQNRARLCLGGSSFVSMRGHRSVQVVSACAQHLMIIPDQSGPTCVDENKHCTIWESWGECTSNPEFMLSSCKLSCGACPTLPPTLVFESSPVGDHLDRFGCCSSCVPVAV
jgi:hypothetical protein